jgi:hypothetical protein
LGTLPQQWCFHHRELVLGSFLCQAPPSFAQYPVLSVLFLHFAHLGCIIRCIYASFILVWAVHFVHAYCLGMLIFKTPDPYFLAWCIVIPVTCCCSHDSSTPVLPIVLWCCNLIFVFLFIASW